MLENGRAVKFKSDSNSDAERDTNMGACAGVLPPHGASLLAAMATAAAIQFVVVGIRGALGQGRRAAALAADKRAQRGVPLPGAEPPHWHILTLTITCRAIYFPRFTSVEFHSQVRFHSLAHTHHAHSALSCCPGLYEAWATDIPSLAGFEANL